ncbi:hypothetical protein D9613_001043 [Agrocybe pediades]|uniref:CID domain-containing protein n=1 Tax=Agrocybe pediades TaxID=84607 RepID=A0A8H4R360_9AGAR|nr:hypothetical protein D9613_001043 [Agrocybe pediades]
MDPFEVRMQFIDILKRLNASQQSIQKLVGFAVKNFPGCGEDIWDCVLEEVQKVSINSRINILYFLDSLCETCLMIKSHTRSERTKEANANGLYMQFVSRDLNKVIEHVVPEGRQGMPNLISTKQILENWRNKRYLEPQRIDQVLAFLDARPKPSISEEAEPSTKSLSKNEVNKRIEQDRERHKRLREGRWVQPTSRNPASVQAGQLASFYPLDTAEELPVDIEFENEWETTSDWNDDDQEAIDEEDHLAFPSSASEDEGEADFAPSKRMRTDSQ